jgi:hypothetical protein
MQATQHRVVQSAVKRMRDMGLEDAHLMGEAAEGEPLRAMPYLAEDGEAGNGNNEQQPASDDADGQLAGMMGM